MVAIGEDFRLQDKVIRFDQDGTGVQVGTATGKIKFGSARKRHGMSKRPHKMVRTARGSQILDERDAKIVRNHLPYDL